MSTASSEESQTGTQTLRKHLLLRAKMEQLSGLLGIRSLMARQEQNRIYDEAAGRAVRRQLFGEHSDVQESNVQPGSTILGDVHYPAPVIVQQPAQSSGGGLLKAALLTALSVAVPGAGAVGWFAQEMLKRQQPPAPPASTKLDSLPSLPGMTRPSPATIVENPPATRQPGLDLNLLQMEDITE